jgi:glutamyl-tRNA synthetase
MNEKWRTKNMSKIRTRFAPSPTGRMHVGNLRTALYAYLIAKHEDGDFILRVEDTDQERFVEGALDIIYRTLEKTGLVHDEGPDKDGGYGPYVQSERNTTGLYLEYAKQLVEQGDAYYCFCDKERLASLKTTVSEGGGTDIIVYDKHCLGLSKEEVESNLAAGKPWVIRLNVPNDGTTAFHDEIYGDITVPNEELDDMILIKSDGYPTYNFANVIDDHLMEITHVVRGNEYLSSAPKYNRLYQAFGWDVPVYVHCPLITDETHKKLSKRCGHSSYEDLIEQGFVSEAVVNFVALLGWSPADTREIFSLEDLVKAFDYHHMNKSPSVFDTVKLKWMNGEYLKMMDFDRFYEMAEPYMKEIITKDYDLKKIAGLIKTRIEVFPDIKEQIDFFEELPEYDIEMYTHKKMKTNAQTSLEVLRDLLPLFEAQEDYSNDALFETLKNYVTEKGFKNGYVMWPVRTAVSGKQNTPGGATEIMDIIGKEESLKRIKIAVDKLAAAQS